MRVLCIGHVLGIAVLLGAAACGPAKPAENAVPASGDETKANADGSSTSPAADREGTPASSTANVAVAPPPAPRGGGVPYDKEAVEVVLKRAARQVKANCGAATGEDGKAAGPWGKTTVTVKLGHNGHSQGATVIAPYDDKPVGKCATQAFAILTYPPFACPDTTVDWPIEVVPPTAAK